MRTEVNGGDSCIEDVDCVVQRMVIGKRGINNCLETKTKLVVTRGQTFCIGVFELKSPKERRFLPKECQDQ